MRRYPVAIVVLLLVATACGGGKKESALTGGSGSSATPGANASVAPGKSSAPSSSGGSKSTTGGSKSGGSSQPSTGTPAKVKVMAGGYAPPKDGKYVYRLDGEATNPFNPTSPPQKFSNETLTKTVSHSGNDVTTEQTTSVSAGRATQRLRWETNRIVLTYIKAETPNGDFTCTFDPPLLITPFPVRAQTIPTQNFKGQGNACSGTLDISIIGQERAKDATGHSWSTWRVRVRTQSNAAQFTQKSDDTRWVAPALAQEVRTQGTTDLSIKGAGGAQNSHGSEQTALKSYPK